MRFDSFSRTSYFAAAIGAIAVAAAISAPLRSVAAERPISLQSAAGRELVESQCSACHSLDYVLMNSPFLSTEQWQASVAKMRTFGAPLSDDDARAIVTYLAGAYGKPAR
jgi:mono/diheme cytochrome c family protein